MRQTLTDIKGEAEGNIIIAVDCNSPLIPMHRSLKQESKKETQVVNDTLEEMDHLSFISCINEISLIALGHSIQM